MFFWIWLKNDKEWYLPQQWPPIHRFRLVFRQRLVWLRLVSKLEQRLVHLAMHSMQHGIRPDRQYIPWSIHVHRVQHMRMSRLYCRGHLEQRHAIGMARDVHKWLRPIHSVNDIVTFLRRNICSQLSKFERVRVLNSRRKKHWKSANCFFYIANCFKIMRKSLNLPAMTAGAGAANR